MSESFDPRRWRALPVVLTASFLAFFDLFAVNVAAPSVQRDLGAGPVALQLLVGGYSFSYALGLIAGGRLGDRHGRDRLFLWGMSAFALSCAASAAAPSAAVLVVARLAQGLSAAAMVPQVLALIQALFPAAERPRALAAFGVNAGLSTIAGQVLGGVLLAVDPLGLGWRAIFAVQVVFAVAAAVAGRRLLPRSRAAAAAALDPAGTLVLAAALALLLLPLVAGRAAGWPLWSPACLLAAVPALAAFAVLQRRLASAAGGRSPMVDPRLFSAEAFTAGLAVTLAFYAELGSFFLVMTLFLQDGLGLAPLAAGLTFAPLGVGFAASSLLARRLVPTLGGRTVLTGGVALVVASLLVAVVAVSALGSEMTALEVVPVMLLVGVGNGLALPTLLGVVLAGVPTRLAGAASGVLMTAQQLGTALGVAGVGAVYLAAAGPHGVATAAGRALATDAALAAVTLVLLRRLPAPAAPVARRSAAADVT